MHFTIPRDALTDALKRTLRAINARAQLPVMQHFLMEATAGCLRVTASDAITTITASVQAEISREGKITLPAKKLAQIADALTGDGPVSFQASAENIMAIACHKAQYKLRGMDAEMYPPLTGTEELATAHSLTIPRGALMRNISKVAYARTTDENRKQLNGVLLSVRGETLTLAATDGRRLAMAETVMPPSNLSDFDVILPEKIALELPRCFPDFGDVKLTIGANLVQFAFLPNPAVSTDKVLACVTSRLIEGSYPNFRSIIPKDSPNSVTIPRAALADALHRVAMINADSGQSISLGLSDGEVVLSASSADLGEARESVDLEYDGPAMDIAFNPQFLLEPLKTLDAETMTLRFKDSFNPVTLSDTEGFLYVLMPMRS